MGGGGSGEGSDNLNVLLFASWPLMTGARMANMSGTSHRNPVVVHLYPSVALRFLFHGIEALGWPLRFITSNGSVGDDIPRGLVSSTPCMVRCILRYWVGDSRRSNVLRDRHLWSKRLRFIRHPRALVRLVRGICFASVMVDVVFVFLPCYLHVCVC